METKNTRAVPSDLHQLQMTFTVTGLDILKAYRDELSCSEGRALTLSKALDGFLKASANAAPSAAEPKATTDDTTAPSAPCYLHLTNSA